MPTFVKDNTISIDLKIKLGWTDPDRYPDAVDVYHEGCYDNCVTYFPQRTSEPIGEWHKISQTQEVRERMCGCCGNELGVDSRNHFPLEIEHLCELPNYCPNCGAKVTKE